MMKEGTANVHASTVREFLTIIAAQAKAALGAARETAEFAVTEAEAAVGAAQDEAEQLAAQEKVTRAKAALAQFRRPGLMQLSRLHPNDDDGGGDARPVPSRFMIDDVERMIEAATIDSAAGHNCYIEARTVRVGLQGRQRGGFEDTDAVFAYVVDGDADKGLGWTPTVPVSLTVETSPGNFHHWLFLKEAITEWSRAKALGDRIRAAIGADHDTGTITQPYRVAGTVNYPGRKKIERGRVTVPTRVVEFDPEVLWTPEEIEEAFPLQQQPEGDGAGTAAGQADEATIPAETMAAIQSTQKQGRGLVLWNVLLVLKDLGWTVGAIVTLLEKYPDGIAQKYRGRLRREVERIYGKIKDRDQPQPIQQQPDPISAEALEKMIFPPIKYIVPEILVEGLTLFASKPKMGKSWLLLHTAIAVATGGFTLGDIHCPEGDVLYCALEDSERRLKGRMRKLGLGFPKRLFFWCQLARLSAGGLDAIRKWIIDHPQARLIIIDILAMVRDPRKREETTYDADYQAVIELRNLAHKFGIAVVVVHHTRKADAEDAFDTVSGTLGLTGAPDSILIMKRNASGNVTLHGKGRDLLEVEKAMEFKRETCVWTIIGEAAAVKRSTERTNILNVINEATEPIGPNDIAVEADMRPISVRKLLPKLVKEGLIEKVSYGKYQRVGAKPAAPAAAPKGIHSADTLGSTDGPAHRPRTEDGYEVIGAEAPATPCSQCGKADGNVLLIRDPFKGVQGAPVHEDCAQAWFAKPQEPPQAPPSPTPADDLFSVGPAAQTRAGQGRRRKRAHQ